MKKKNNSMSSGVSRTLRHIVFERDSYTCVLCSNGACDCHHLIPRSQGGRTYLYNLVSLCRPCHMKYHGEIPIDKSIRQAMYEHMCDYLCAADENEYCKNMGAWLAWLPPSCNSEDAMFADDD